MYGTPNATKIGKKLRVPSVKLYACKIIECRAKIFESRLNRIDGHSKIERIAYEISGRLEIECPSENECRFEIECHFEIKCLFEIGGRFEMECHCENGCQFEVESSFEIEGRFEIEC